jgi:hypothetical protein
MMRYRILPYKQGSKSAKALATALNGKVLRLEGSTFKPKPDDIVINWGNSGPDSPPYGGYRLFNDPMVVGCASNKLKFFELMKDTGLTPQYWTEKEDIPDEAFPIVCRTLLNSHSGNGIVIADTVDGVVDAKLYVKYEKKKEEYRVHVGRRSEEAVIISVQRKARRLDCEPASWQIRNHANGFVYIREGINPPNSVIANAEEAFRATGLDFGAVDVIWNESKEKAYVLEINTAPGLEGTTITDYAEFFRGLV